MCGSAAAVAVSAGGVGGVVAPLKTPPSNIPPTPPHLILFPSDVSTTQLPEFAPLFAQSNDASGVKSNPTFALRSSSTNPVGPGLLTLAQMIAIVTAVNASRM